VALDQNVTPSATEPTRGSAIENEIPAYRAISPGAVISLIFGVLALFCFADYLFLPCAAFAVVIGLLADRKIQRYPEVLTGRGLAQAGIALGLIFGLASVTTGTVQSYLRKYSATKFARGYVKVLKDGGIEDAFWYTRLPDARKNKSPAEVYKEFQSGVREPIVLDSEIGMIKAIQKRLASNPGQEIHFSKIENQSTDGLAIIATALLELHGPPTKPYRDQEYALLNLKADGRKSRYEWWVESIIYPYEPSTFVPAPKPVDDGHGHGHAH